VRREKKSETRRKKEKSINEGRYRSEIREEGNN
jgi:hypothetical protein